MRKVESWAEHVRRWRSSGLTRAVYCAEHGVKAAAIPRASCHPKRSPGCVRGSAGDDWVIASCHGTWC